MKIDRLIVEQCDLNSFNFNESDPLNSLNHSVISYFMCMRSNRIEFHFDDGSIFLAKDRFAPYTGWIKFKDKQEESEK